MHSVLRASALWLAVIVLVLSAGGGCSGGESPVELAGTAEEALRSPAPCGLPDATLPPSPGADAGSACRVLELTATKRYSPSRWTDDVRTVVPPIRFALPAEIPVTDGNAGNHWTNFDYALGTGVPVHCIYKGGSSQAHPNSASEIAKGKRYVFSRCDNGAVAGTVVKADFVSLHIANGDSYVPTRTNARTTVRMLLTEVSPCAGAADAGDAGADASVDADPTDAADADAQEPADANDAAEDAQDAAEDAQDAAEDASDDAADSSDAQDADDAADAESDAPSCVPELCDDSNPCTDDLCGAEDTCVHPPRIAGAACGDTNVCNGVEQCNGAGACIPGAPAPLDDGNPCTTDACDPALGPTHTPVATGTSCADSNACNGAETCNPAGVCASGAPPLVDDGNPCTVDTCDPALGVRHMPAAAGTLCADDNACNGLETCDAEARCIAGVPPVVDDGNACTADACDPALGPVHLPLPAGTSCSDANACNGAEVCNGAGTCAAGMPPVVDDGNACTVDTCDPASGILHAAKPAGSLCSDSNACNGIEVCSASGDCLGGTPPVVDDGNLCTRDTCDPQSGVRHDPIPGCDPTPTDRETTLETRASLIGRVVTSTGAPLDGASISIFDVPAIGAPRGDAVVTRTSGGAFRVHLASFPETQGEHSPAHRVLLRIDAPGAIPVTRDADLRPGSIADLGTIVVAQRDELVTTIGPSGGTATDSRGLVSVIIPAGVLASDTPIRITPFLRREELPHPLPDVTVTTYAFELEPDGLQFAQPVTVRVANYRDLPTALEIPVGSVDRITGRWRDEGVATWDPAAGAFTFQATHFSTWDANPSSSGQYVTWTRQGNDPSKAAAKCGLGSAVGLANGTLRQSFELPATMRHERAYAVGLTYDSLSGASARIAAPGTLNTSTDGPSSGATPIAVTKLSRSVASMSVKTACLPRGEADRVLSASPGGACGGGSCAPGSVVFPNMAARLETLGRVDELDVPDGSGELEVGAFMPLPGDSNGVIAPDFIPQKVTLAPVAGASACVARSDARFGQPTPRPSPTGNVLESNEISIPTTPGPYAVIERSVFVHHKLTSPFGAGWSIDGLRRLYANDRGAGADEAILVHASGEQERFTPRANISELALPTGASGFPVFARDTTTGEAFVAVSGGGVYRVEPDGATTPVLTGLAFGGKTARAMAVAYVGGARRFVIMLDGQLVDVDAVGTMRTLHTYTARTGSVEFAKTPGLAVWGDVAYFTEARPPRPLLFRVRLDTATPIAENISAPEGDSASLALDPQRPLSQVRFGDPKGIAFGRDGALYVADRLRGVVYRVRPEVAGGIGPTSHVEIALGDGAGRLLLPVGVRREARAFALNQPVALSLAPDGTMFVLSVAGVVAYDIAAERAKWVFAPANHPDSDLRYLRFDWVERLQVLGLDANTFLVASGYTIHRVDVTPYTSETEPTRTLARDPLGFLLTDTVADVVEAYDTSGRLRERRTRPGNVIARFEYVDEKSDRIAKMLDAAGGETVFAYDVRKKLESITDPAGRVTAVKIDDRGDLVTITTPTASGKEPDVRSFTYDKHRMTKKVAARGDETTYDWRDDGTLRATHKATGESYTEITPALTQPRETDASGYPLSHGSYVDPRGVKHDVWIDKNGGVAREAYVADGVPYDVRASYAAELVGTSSSDSRINKLRRISGTSVNGLGAGEAVIFDALGRPLATGLTSNPNGGDRIYNYAYRPDGRLERIANWSNETALRFDYDPSGRLAKSYEWFRHTNQERAVERFAWRGDGLLATSDAAGVTTTYAYDTNGNATGTTDTAGHTSTVTRDPLTGMVTSASDGVATTNYAYDLANRLTVVTDGEGNATRLGYTQLPCGCREEDRVTRLETPDLPAGLAWTFEYGPEGRIVAASDPSGETERYEYSPTTNELTKVKDRRGRERAMTYDALGRLRASIDPLRRRFGRSYALPEARGFTGGSVVGATAPGASDDAIAKTSLTSTLDVGEYQLGTTAYDFNEPHARSRGLAAVTFYRDATFQVSYAHGYDDYGRLSQRDDRGGTAIDNPATSGFLYQSPRVSDGFGRASNFHDVVQNHTMRASGGSRSTTRQLTSNYDPSEIQGVGSPEQGLSVTIERDAFERPKTIRRFYYGDVALSGAPTQSTYAYYPNGRLQTIDGPAGKRTFHYDARGFVERVVVEGEGTYAFHYDAVGRSDRVTYPDGHRRVQQYDINGRLRERCYEYLDANGERDPSRTRCYGAAYDANGSPTKLSDPAGEDVITTDELDRLTRVTRGAEVQEYTYNALSAVKGNAGLALDDQRPRLAGSGTADAAVPASAGGQPVTLDAAGRITSLHGATLGYAAGTRVASVTQGTTTERFAYDGSLRRFARTVGPNDPTNRIFVYEGDELAAVLDPAGQRVEDFLYAEVDHPLRLRRGTSVVYYELDLAGNVRRLRAPGGGDLGGYRYAAFGKTLENTASVDQMLRWKGRPFIDRAGGLYDMRARWWSPELAAFTAIDELVFHDTRSTLWGWPRQNPIRWSDPSGHDVEDWFLGRGADDAMLYAGAVSLAALTVATGGAVADLTGSVLASGMAEGWLLAYGVNVAGQALTKGGLNCVDIGEALSAAGEGSLGGFLGAGIGALASKAGGALAAALQSSGAAVGSRAGGFAAGGAGGTLSEAERAGLQRVANEFDTEIHVVGSRAAGSGRGVGSDLPVGKDPPGLPGTTRSDIDLRVDSEVDIRTGGRFSDALKNIGPEGLVDVRPLIGPPHAPFITIKPTR